MSEEEQYLNIRKQLNIMPKERIIDNFLRLVKLHNKILQERNARREKEYSLGGKLC